MSPVHAESIGLVRNLASGYISPQWHLVYDDWCETVYSPGDQEPGQWEHLCTFNRYETHFDEGQAPMLADEWLTPTEQEANKTHQRLAGIRQEQHRTWQNSLLVDKDSREDFTFQNPPPIELTPPQDPAAPIRHSPTPPSAPLHSSWTRDDQSTTLPSSSTPSSSPRRSSRQKAPITRLVPKFTGKSYSNPSSLLFTVVALSKGITPQSAAMLQAQVLGYDPATGLQEWLPPGINQSPKSYL